MHSRSRTFVRPIVLVAITAALTGLSLTGLFWRRSARGLAGDVYRWVSSAAELDLKTRPDMERFAFDRSLYEFTRTPPVDSAVDDPESPNYSIRRGLEVKVHTAGYTYPVNIAFARGGGSDPESPFYYVAELHGTIKYATRSGAVREFAAGLLDHPPTKMQQSDEFGLSGLALAPGTDDLIVTHPVSDPKTGLFLSAITRLFSQDGGRTCSRRERILLLENEPTCPSNQIQQALFGPDGRLYVSVGDAMNYSLALDPGRWGGKILRMNADGSPCEENPFRDPAHPGSPRSYAWAIGLRNSFDFVHAPAEGRGEPDRSPRIFAGDVGETLNRIVVAGAGSDHGWDGTPESFCRHAAYLFQDRFVPAGMTLIDPKVMGEEYSGALWLAGYSYYFGPDPGASKRIVSFRVKGATLREGPAGILSYRGKGQSTLLGLEQGPDGVYVTDFFGEQRTGDAGGLGKVLRIVPSARTRELPVDLRPPGWKEMSPRNRGKHIFVRRAGCGACHTVEKLSGGREGPELTSLVPSLRARLSSRDYVASARAILEGAEPGAAQEIRKVLEASGDEKLRSWLRFHLRDPRFDNPKGKMPQFTSLSDEEIGYLVEFLMGLD